MKPKYTHIPQFGSGEFPDFRQPGAWYVDKSLLIRDVLLGSQCLLLPRPRRFGKTLNMNMLKCWFDITRKNQDELFAGLKIMQEEPKILATRGAHPVIFLSLKDWKCGDIDKLQQTLVGRMAQLLSPHRHDFVALDSVQQMILERILEQQGTDDDLKQSLALLMEALHLKHGKKVMILIDEYDAPVLHAISEGFAKPAIALLGPWLSSALKNNDHLEKAVLTGILCLAQQSIFSDLNHFTCYSVIDAGDFADKFGFTEEETQQALIEFGRQDQAEDVRGWYNGYNFNGIQIYNPWSLGEFLVRGNLAPHWLNTSSNQLIFTELARAGEPLLQELEKLLQGESIITQLSDRATLRDLVDDTPRDILFSFFVLCGYLKAHDKFVDEGDLLESWHVSIPNREIEAVFAEFVRQVTSSRKGLPKLNSPLLQSFIADDAPKFQRELNDFLKGVASYHDTAKTPEIFLHGLILGLLLPLRSHYRLESNIESGEGRADLICRPKTPGFTAKLIEFKAVAKDADLDALADAAIAQIDDNDYAARLREEGIHDFAKLSVVISGKKCRVRKA